MKGDIETGHRKPLNLLDLAGGVEFEPDFDHKALRELREPGGAPVVHSIESGTVPDGSVLRPSRIVRG